MSWFTTERRVLSAAVSVAIDPDVGFPAWQLALTMQPFYRSRGYSHDWLDTMRIALEANGRDTDLPGRGTCSESLAEASLHLPGPPTASGTWSGHKPPTGNSGTPPSTPSVTRSSDRSSSSDGGAGGHGTEGTGHRRGRDYRLEALRRADQPAPGTSLAAAGIGHKALLRFTAKLRATR